jgi:hypothetical protein
MPLTNRGVTDAQPAAPRQPPNAVLLYQGIRQDRIWRVTSRTVIIASDAGLSPPAAGVDVLPNKPAMAPGPGVTAASEVVECVS